MGCKNNVLPDYPVTKEVLATRTGVVTAHPAATKIGVDILKNGGNAADAAIAVQFALAVCYPRAGNLGGGGFLLYRDSSGEVTSLDFREKAPKSASRDMYLDDNGKPVDEKSKLGSLACGVPGTVDGMYTFFLTYSKLKDWAKLIAPAIRLAEEGYRITEDEASLLQKNQTNFSRYNDYITAFTRHSWKKGDILVQSDLAGTLKEIQQNGRNGFYQGKIADKIVQAIESHNGLVTRQDLLSYTSKWRIPVSCMYRGYKVYSMGPPSSGGIALIQLLKLTEKFDVAEWDFHGCEHIEQSAFAEQIVFSLRERYLGDPDFFKVPVQDLLDSAALNDYQKHSNYIAKLDTKSESEETTHFSIADEYGNAVSVTTTLNGNYGSFFIPEGTGIIMNNEMDDFSVKSGHPNMFGVIGYEANKIEPGKRMLSSMTPTIIEKDGKLFAVLGTPGGSTIITSVFQAIQNLIDFEMEPFHAVSAPRFHYQGKPDTIFYEEKNFPEVLPELNSMGYKHKKRSPIGRVEVIKISKEGNLYLGADPRGDDDAKGY